RQHRPLLAPTRDELDSRAAWTVLDRIVQEVPYRLTEHQAIRPGEDRSLASDREVLLLLLGEDRKLPGGLLGDRLEIQALGGEGGLARVGASEIEEALH